MSSPALLSPAQLELDLAIPDLSDPSDGPHAIQQLVHLAVTALSGQWQLTSDQVRWCGGPRVVPVADNYDRLGYDPADITRAARYTRYVGARQMLRSHATAMVPPALRQLAADRADDVLLVCPGITYRRGVIDPAPPRTAPPPRPRGGEAPPPARRRTDDRARRPARR